MLVLSRKPEENFCFPNLGVNIRVLSVKGRSVRIGIDAPKELQILRGELNSNPESFAENRFGDKAHQWKNQLNIIKLSLVLSERNFQAGNLEDGEAALLEAIRALAKIEQSTAQLPIEPTPSTGPPKRVLLVEDDANELRLLAGLLRLEGYEVVTASDGNEAIQQLDEFDATPDFVLLDMRMPHRNGPETIRWIRSQESLQALSVFSVSATSPEELGVPIGPEGVNEWFPKPLDPVGLLNRLGSVHSAAV